MAPVPADLETSGSEYCTSNDSAESDGCDPTDSHLSEEDSDGREYLPSALGLTFENPLGEKIRIYSRDSEERFDWDTEFLVGMRVWTPMSQGTNTPHSIWAGRFHRPYRAPLSRNDPEFIRAAINHLWRVTHTQSPFISVWAAPRPAIQRLVGSENATIAFFDIDYLANDNTEYTPIHPAACLIKQYRLLEIGFPDKTAFKYKGGREYLVWQHIDKHALFTTLSKAQFDLHCMQNPDLKVVLQLERLSKWELVKQFHRDLPGVVLCNARAGFAIGRLLKRVDIPRRSVEKFSALFARQFELLGYKRKKSLARYHEGVWKGFYCDLGVYNQPTIPRSIREEPLLVSKISDEESPCVGKKQGPAQRARPGLKSYRNTQFSVSEQAKQASWQTESRSATIDSTPRYGLRKHKGITERSTESKTEFEPLSVTTRDLIRSKPLSPSPAPSPAPSLTSALSKPDSEPQAVTSTALLKPKNVLAPPAYNYEDANEDLYAAGVAVYTADTAMNDGHSSVLSDSATLVGDLSDTHSDDTPMISAANIKEFSTLVNHFRCQGERYKSVTTSSSSDADTSDTPMDDIPVKTARSLENFSTLVNKFQCQGEQHKIMVASSGSDADSEKSGDTSIRKRRTPYHTHKTLKRARPYYKDDYFMRNRRRINKALREHRRRIVAYE